MCSEPLDNPAVRQFDRKCLHVFTDEFDKHNQEVDQKVLTTVQYLLSFWHLHCFNGIAVGRLACVSPLLHL